MNKKLLIVLMSVFLFACAGTSFKWNDARQIKQGMTKIQVEQLIGKPTSVSTLGDQTVYVWVHVNTLTGKTKSLRINFDKEGRAIESPVIPPEFVD